MRSKKKILIATYPFGKSGKKQLQLLQETGWELIFNPYNRRLKSGEVEKLIQDIDAVIAGTEQYSINALSNSKLKVISRVGIGLDNVPLKSCYERGIKVTYTPDAPSQAVAELTLANILNLARSIHLSDRSVRQYAWNRYLGFLLKEMKIGIIGIGRIGKLVVKLLQPFGAKILACDIKPDIEFARIFNLEWLDKDSILRESDLTTLHIPYNKMNHHFIDRSSIAKMKTNSFLINTSRGQIVDEDAILDALKQKHLAGAAIDVFGTEPYEGPLLKIDNVILTAHIGASANESRYFMELGAVEDCINVLNGREPLHNAILDNPEELE